MSSEANERGRSGASAGPPAALLTPEALATMLGLAVATLADWRVDGRGPRFIRLGRLIRYQPAVVAAWLAQQERASTSDRGHVRSA